MNASNSYGYRKHIHELCKLCGQNSRLKSCRKKRRKKDNDTTVEKLWKENEEEKKITIVQLEVVSPASLNADQSGKPITSITLMGGTPVNTEKTEITKC